MAPSFQDGRWHFGGSPGAVFESIYQGRPEGMPSWGGRISNDQIWMLTSYVRSLRGAREVEFAELYQGYRKLAIGADELITAVSLPTPPTRGRAFFRKVGTRRAQSISKVVFAGLIAFALDKSVSYVRLAYGSTRLEPKAVAKAREALKADFTPIDDVRSERDYREMVAGNVLAQFVRSISA